VTALFFKGGALGFKGRYHAIRKEYIDAANTGRDALNTLEESQKIAPGNHDIMLGTGIYNYFAIVIPERYPLLKPAMLFLPRGDRTLGLLQLKAAASKAQYAHVEAKWILVGAYYDWEKDAVRAMPFAKELAETYPNNPAFQRAYGRCLVRLGPLDKMEALWREVLVNYMDKRTGYDEYAAREALYYIGVRRMIEGDNDIALQYFYKCDEASRLLDTEGPSGFMVKLNLMVGKIYDLQGKRDLAIKQYRKVISMKDYDGTQAEAETYVRTPYRR
jgi:tetratricopeptide (TPR) repeat protein